jgi:hypothetical protein
LMSKEEGKKIRYPLKKKKKKKLKDKQNN